MGVERRTIPIEEAHKGFQAMLAESFADPAPDLAEENLHSRVRGTALITNRYAG